MIINCRIFLQTLVTATTILLLLYGMVFRCFAEEPPEAFSQSFPLDAASDSFDALPESLPLESSSELPVESEPPAESSEPAAESSEPAAESSEPMQERELQADDEPSVLDSGAPPDGMERPVDTPDDIHQIRLYIEFFLFGVFPIKIAVFLIFLFCRWFSRTFIDPSL